MNILNETISISYFIKQINDQLQAGVDPIILSPQGLRVLYPFVRCLDPYLPRDKAEVLVKLLPVVNFHANAFGYSAPGRIFIKRRKFWEFIHFFENELECHYDPARIPAVYSDGLEYIFEGFDRLRKLSKTDSVVKDNYKLLGGTLAYLIDHHLKDQLTTPVYPVTPDWHIYPTDDLEVLVGFYNISRRETETGWIYTNLDGAGEQLTSTADLDPFILTHLLTRNTQERLMYKANSKADFKVINTHLFGDYNPWSKK